MRLFAVPCNPLERQSQVLCHRRWLALSKWSNSSEYHQLASVPHDFIVFHLHSEHRITRGVAGFWTEQRKLFHVSSSEVPFKIVNGDVGVEIVDALSSEILGESTTNLHHQRIDCDLDNFISLNRYGYRSRQLWTVGVVVFRSPLWFFLGRTTAWIPNHRGDFARWQFRHGCWWIGCGR